MIQDINFNKHCLINDNIYILTKVINLYISYILNPWLKNLNTDLTLNNLFFGYGRRTKNTNLDKSIYTIKK